MSDQKPVGLLWDSVSNNTGDKAIGLVMRRFCETRGIGFEVLDPFSYDPGRYSTILVGGGELIRKRGDPFYDCFRVEGAHILNAAGSYLPDHVDYLRDYSLVVVRSEAEKQSLDGEIPNVKARPCVATVLGDFYPRQLAAAVPDRRHNDKPRLGVHLHWGTLQSVPDIAEGLRRLNRAYHIVFVPFTLYNSDYQLLEALARHLPDASVNTARDPVEIYYSISSLDGMIASSLHAAIFALMQNVPVMAFPYAPKVEQHFRDRGLEGWTFHSVPEMVQKALEPEFLELEYPNLAERDRQSVYQHLDEVAALVGERGQQSGRNPLSRLPTIDRGEQALTYHKTLMHYLGYVGELRAQLEESAAQVLEKDEALQRITDSTGWQILSAFRRVRIWLVPPGTWRERMWQLMLSGLRLWKSQGFRAFTRRGVDRIRGQTRRLSGKHDVAGPTPSNDGSGRST